MAICLCELILNDLKRLYSVFSNSTFWEKSHGSKEPWKGQHNALDDDKEPKNLFKLGHDLRQKVFISDPLN